MTELDNEWLNQRGISTHTLPEEDRLTLLEKANSELELRVGNKLAQNLTDTQIAEFETLLDTGGDTLGWLEQNYHDYPRTVHAELAALEKEIESSAQPIALIMSWSSPQ